MHSPKFFSALSLIQSNMYYQKKKCIPEILFNLIMYNSYIEGFPHVLWGGGALQNLIWGGGLSQYMGGGWGELKMLSKNTCEGVYLMVKLPAISLQIY